ncbi:magnesium and cobalt efflux protein CorC [Cutibacterium acnes JCM 18909]|nr:magnesium and cobalt efflux protein CorC [Cutibacterium acnes JCM 18909]
MLILIGNALTPGKGYAEGPFTSEAELREMVDYAEASDLIEAGEREMIHSVFELGDTLTKEVMVPRTDVVYIPRTKNLRQAMSLALRSGFSRVPVVGEGFDDIRGIVYLKDLSQRYSTILTVTPPKASNRLCGLPRSAQTLSPSTRCCAKCSETVTISSSSWTSLAARLA